MWGSLMAQWVKSLPAMQKTQETWVLFPAGGNGTPLQYSGLENPMGRGAWRATVHGAAKSQTGLNDLAHRETLVSHMHGG